jgi:hypothetical protein
VKLQKLERRLFAATDRFLWRLLGRLMRTSAGPLRARIATNLIRLQSALHHAQDKRVKAAKLREQWPKRCGCGRTYVRTPRDPREADGARVWASLPFGYARRDEYASAEARHCVCGSTLEIYTQIHDLSAE